MIDGRQDAFICHDCLALSFSSQELLEHQQEMGHKMAAEIKIDAVADVGDKRILMFELSDE